MESIKANDLVYVYKECPWCHSNGSIGVYFTALKVESLEATMVCCRHNFTGKVVFDTPEAGFPIGIVKKVPPLKELEGIKKDEYIREPI